MACFRPIDAWQREDGQVIFVERGKIRRKLVLPCGQCIGCRSDRSRAWAVRVMHECQMHGENSFVTLTYDDSHAPVDGSLRYRDFQLFMKRLRREYGKARFYMCGEYGEKFKRPHFHVCLFGVGFDDRYLWRHSGSGFSLYRSAQLERLWPLGSCEVGDVSFESAAYVARYSMKKVTGVAAEQHYLRVDGDTGEVFWVLPEFCRMSLKPGIGASFMDKYYSDVFPRDYVVMAGRKVKVPRYYNQWLKLLDDCFVVDEARASRVSPPEDNTPERLEVREQVFAARLSHKVRSVE